MSSLIYSHQRSGSTNALFFAQEVQDISQDGMETLTPIAMTKGFPGWRSRRYPKIQKYIDEVHAETPIVKHIYGAHSADIDSLILRSKHLERIVLLRRENREAAALSAIIARRIKAWHEKPAESVGTIAVQEIKQLANKYGRAATLAEDMCKRSGKPVTAVSYESLYGASGDERVNAALNFLQALTGEEFDSSSPKFQKAFENHLSPEKKIGTSETARKVDNFEEILTEYPNITA